jgi:hypothetical protein
MVADFFVLAATDKIWHTGSVPKHYLKNLNVLAAANAE